VAGIELHADYDRDGRLTRSAPERAARLQWPGAIVVPNLDRDQRRLPVSVGNASLAQADYDRATVHSADDEVVPLEIRVPAGALQTGERLVIRCSGIMHTRVRLSDASGVIIGHRLAAPEIYELPAMPANGIFGFSLQVRTIAGAAFGRVSNLDLRYREDQREETRFTLTLMRRDTNGVEHVEDQGRFSVAPFILVDRLARAYRVYMVNNADNWPAFSDFWRAAGRARVPVIDVDWRFTGNDTWVQDQYQHSLLQGVNGWRELILHLPRLRHDNANNTVTENLEEFVNSHFRSRNIGLYRDLWDRVVPVPTATHTIARPSFRELEAWIKKANRIMSAISEINRAGAFADSAWRQINPDTWVDALFALQSSLDRLHRTIGEARNGAPPERDAQLDGLKAATQALVDAALGEFSVGGSANPTVVSDLGGTSVTLTRNRALELFNRARQMHDSMNYGGNIESTPPVSGASLGKIIIGNATNPDTGGEMMDPDLLRVLAKQKKQPLVELDTSWLRVGHVDEMMAVVPHGRRRSGFSVLHASARAAMEILTRAEARYRAGLPAAHPMNTPERRPPSGVLPRLMTDGSAPLTRLFRGKAWLHVHTRARPGQVERQQLPPSIYMRLSEAFGGGSGFNVHRIGFVPGIGPTRRYPADITPTELLWAETDRTGKSSNIAIDDQFLHASRSILENELPGIAVLPVPVLFERVDNVDLFRRFYWRDPTTAFSPDVANSQVLNGHILVPKPYGPRMHTDDAIAVVQGAMKAVKIPAGIRARVGRRLISAQHMTRASYWVEKVDPAYLTSSIGTIRASYGGMRTEDDVKAVFKDSFPGADDAALERHIIHPNRRHFDGRGMLRKDHSLFRFRDDMVDLFELFIAAVAAQLGVRLHFVDSWFYHLGEGEIHCGSNVLRKPRSRLAGVPNVWDAPDHNFRSRTIRFDQADPIQASGGR